MPEEITALVTELEMPEEQREHCSRMNALHITPLERTTRETNSLLTGRIRDGSKKYRRAPGSFCVRSSVIYTSQYNMFLC